MEELECFVLRSERLESIMVKLERWYNVDVVFEDPALKNFKFSGKSESL